MRSRLRLLLLLLVLAVVVWLWLGDRPQPVPAGGGPGERPPPAAAGEARSPTRRAGRPPRSLHPEVLAAARRHLGATARSGHCGPYELLTDVDAAPVLEICQRIGSELDEVYRRRFGLEPLGRPADAVLLFSSAQAFRRFADETAGLRVGYAGFSDASRGFVALHVEGEPLAETAATLAHELTHLVHRRALGPGLAPWLSEGLADAIGDAATPEGLGELAGRRGAEALAARLAGAYELGRVRPLRELVALRRAEFDRGTVSFDYEQSALLVRYLLADGELAPRFRRFLRRLAEGERYGPELLRENLLISWEELDRGLERWVRE